MGISGIHIQISERKKGAFFFISLFTLFIFVFLKKHIKECFRSGYVFIFTFYFLLPVHGRESIVFVSNFRNRDFDGFTCFRVP